MKNKRLTLEIDYDLSIALSRLPDETQIMFMNILKQVQQEYDDMTHTEVKIISL